MAYLKKLVLKGFKSFARETPIEFSDSMNVIVGPNGSGKSNIADAICFVLGRMSIKSMRAAKSSNLIFAGTKQYKPSGEASVKLVLDNSDKTLPLSQKEIMIERTVRKKGQSVYKINDDIKTRQEVLELLAQAGIDPYGFNIILQGEIDSLVKMHSEDRRKIIEEVAGISIYENRKQKSLRELEKTDEKLKEVSTTLRERTAYLRNLEEERQQALRYKKLEKDKKKCEASIIKRKLAEKAKELENINKQQEAKLKEKEKEKNKESDSRKEIQGIEEKIGKINLQISKASGIEQERLNREISDLRAELAGLDVRRENNEEKLSEILTRKEKTQEEIKNIKSILEKLRKDSAPTKKQEELEKKKQEAGEIEKERKLFYTFKEKLNSFKEKIKDRESNLQKISNQSSFLLNEIDSVSKNLKYLEAQPCQKNLEKLREKQEEIEKSLEDIQGKFQEQEKTASVISSEISSLGKIKSQISKFDICPLCHSKITQEHIKHVFKEADDKISFLNHELENRQRAIETGKIQTHKLKSELSSLKQEILKADTDLIKLENIEEKKNQIKNLSNEQETLKKDVLILEKERITIEKKILQYKDIEERYDRIFLELQEISSRTEENVDAELKFKERDLEKAKIIIKQFDREEIDLKEDLEEIKQNIDSNSKELEKKELQNSELEEKYRKLIDFKQNLEKQIHQNNYSLIQIQNKIGNADNEINNLKIEIAKLNAEKENLDVDFEIYKEIEIINLPIYSLEDKLKKTQELLGNIGSVNLRALEVYDKMKQEYDAIYEKVNVLNKEKEEIIKIIEEIDKKKRKTFIKTLEAINSLFSRNFTQLYTKGEAFLELENKDDPFSAGLDIVIKVGRGKYFDVTSLSGGEQTLVALSLIFAIQEYRPYHFYIFDEVDAALDKRNSERLASLVKRYMKTGQYIIITHNDAIITESSLLYGVSMQEGLSKVLSLEV